MVIILFLFCIAILLVSTIWIIDLYKKLRNKQTQLDFANCDIKKERRPSFNISIYAILTDEKEIKYRIKDNWIGNIYHNGTEQVYDESLSKYKLLDKTALIEKFNTIPETEDYLSKLILNKFTKINKDANVKTIQFE